MKKNKKLGADTSAAALAEKSTLLADLSAAQVLLAEKDGEECFLKLAHGVERSVFLKPSVHLDCIATTGCKASTEVKQ